MNSIHGYISEVIRELTELYRLTYDKDWESVYIFNDVYDLVMALWNKGAIDDSGLAMDILKFYFDYNKFRSIDPAQYDNYGYIDIIAAAKNADLINQLEHLVRCVV